jgi:hypothetical protein
LEFGQPGQTYQIGVREYKTGKIGSTSQLDWWEILQVPPTECQERIEFNYRELVRVYSYSQLDNATIQEKITLLHWAYESWRRLLRLRQTERTSSISSRGTQSAPQSEQLSLLGARSLRAYAHADAKGDYVGVASPPEISPGSHRLLEGGDAS